MKSTGPHLKLRVESSQNKTYGNAPRSLLNKSKQAGEPHKSAERTVNHNFTINSNFHNGQYVSGGKWPSGTADFCTVAVGCGAGLWPAELSGRLACILYWDLILRNSVTAAVSVAVISSYPPPSPTSGLAISTLSRLANGSVLLTMKVTTGRSYRLECSEDLTNWTPMIVPLRAGAETLQWIAHPSPSMEGKKFYRLVELPD